MSSAICDFHPDRAAVDKCEECGKRICLDCKKVYRGTNPKGGFFNSNFSQKNRSEVRYVLCPHCYYQTVVKSKSDIDLTGLWIVGFIAAFFIMIIGLFSFLGIFSASSWLFGFFLLFFLISLVMVSFVFIVPLISQYRSSSKSVNDATLDYNAFLNDLEMGIEPTSSHSSHYENYGAPRQFCRNCGKELSIEDNFCSRCGSTL
ncbi:MAG: zinc ribbon domain-containing protein [Promethearchaeota archaeon]